jgi:hypothetical protein
MPIELLAPGTGVDGNGSPELEFVPNPGSVLTLEPHLIDPFQYRRSAWPQSSKPIKPRVAYLGEELPSMASR